MAQRIEFLMCSPNGRYGFPIMNAMLGVAAGDDTVKVRATAMYEGQCDLLVLWGVGAPIKAAARQMQRERGGATLCWDVGYFKGDGPDAYTRVSIDHEHPQSLLDATPTDRARFDELGITLRSDYKENGHIVLAALGRKSRAYLGSRVDQWEQKKLVELRRRFPDRRVIYRPKPTRSRAPGWLVPLDCETDYVSPIEDLLKGASLIVSHHSNVSIDACVAGVPFETDDGAAMWLKQKDYTFQNRLDFLTRLCWWQWRAREAGQAWKFIKWFLREHYDRVKAAA